MAVYAVLIVSALLFELALNLPIGAMPLALSAEGSSDAAVAVTMGCGIFAALVASLPVGALVDKIGRLTTIRIAAAGGAASMLGLAYAHGPVWSGILLGIRGIAVIAYMTAEFAYASEMTSKERAVSGVATLGMVGNVTFATAPALGVFLYAHGFGRGQFAYGAAAAALGAACLWLLPAKYDVRQRGAKRPPIVMHPRWLPATAFGAATILQGGVNGSLAVLTFQHRGIVNGAAIFSAQALTAFLLRYPAGRLVDRFGPRAIALPAALFQALGCVLAASAHSLTSVVIAGLCLGTAWSAVVPITLGLLFEHSSSYTRGAAMGAYNLAFNGGAAAGALLATSVTLAGGGYTVAIALCALAPLGVLPYVLRSRSGARLRAARIAAGS